MKTFLKSAQNQSLSSEITREALTKSAVLYQSFFNRNWPRKFLRNRPFFPRICPWKSREIWRFFPRPTRSPENLGKVLISQSRQLHPRESNPNRPFSSCCLPLCVETSVRAKPFIMKISSAYRVVYVNQTYFCKKGFKQTCFETEAEAETTLKWPVGKNNFQDLQA